MLPATTRWPARWRSTVEVVALSVVIVWGPSPRRSNVAARSLNPPEDASSSGVLSNGAIREVSSIGPAVIDSPLRRSGDRIDPAGGERMAAGQASHGEDRAPHQPVAEQRLDRVLTARRAELARSREVRAKDDLVAADESHDEPNCEPVKPPPPFDESNCARVG